MVKTPKKKTPPKQSKKKVVSRQKKEGSWVMVWVNKSAAEVASAGPGFIIFPQDFPFGSLLYSNGDDAILPVEGGNDGDTLRKANGIPTYVP